VQRREATAWWSARGRSGLTGGGPWCLDGQRVTQRLSRARGVRRPELDEHRGPVTVSAPTATSLIRALEPRGARVGKAE